jgi:hypothetical protein
MGAKRWGHPAYRKAQNGFQMRRTIKALLLVLIAFVPGLAQTPPLLLVAGQQTFVSAPANCGLNAWSSSDPLVLSIQQVGQSLYRFDALKPGNSYITFNCNGHLGTYSLAVQSADYKTYLCPDQISSTYAVPDGWTIEQRQQRVLSFHRAVLEGNKLSCFYGARDDVTLSRTLSGHCSLSPNRKGAYCQP